MSVVTYFTFGLRYAREPHPSWGLAHPDGYLKVTAETYEDARAFVHEFLGTHYAFSYPEKEFDDSWHPLGELAHANLLDNEAATYAEDAAESAAYTAYNTLAEEETQ